MVARRLWLVIALVGLFPASSEASYWIYYGDLDVWAGGAYAYTYAEVPYGWVNYSGLTLERNGNEVGSTSGHSSYAGQGVYLWLSTGESPPPYTLYEANGSVEGELPDYGWFFDWFWDVGFTPGPSVSVDSASIPGESISVTLEPLGGYGTLTVQIEGSTTHSVYQGTVPGGSQSVNFDIPNLPNGQEFWVVRATWEPNGFWASNTRNYHFKVLGDYNNTRYNTPTEEYCSGDPVDIGYTTGDCQIVQNCSFNYFQGRSGWWDEVEENGSGQSRSVGVVSREWYCAGPPRRARQVPGPCPKCEGMSLIPGATVAVMPNHPDLSCGDRVFVHTVGEVTVTDNGGGLVTEQLDHYAGFGGCNRNAGTIGVRKAIKLF